MLLKEIYFKPSLKEKHSLLGISMEPLKIPPQGQTKGSDVEDYQWKIAVCSIWGL